MATWAKILLIVGSLAGSFFGSHTLWQAVKARKIAVIYNRSGKETIYDRDENPRMYWLSCSFIAVLVAMVVVAGIWIACR
jgi:hypothetical protein